ncbi:MAG: serine/threonine-protein kinase [Candidatus Omnitrophica bacterium]|nr:serine/threonine-protein kinase [Candidatus Omnitrophota bacterium]MDD5352542.1 serine/threonine-protein kinase [Candidatus Omnitrophota bacterium]MDD5550140.1 serine/threonine-protein kinase [Candidatus Omnitrophota bacterium]
MALPNLTKEDINKILVDTPVAVMGKPAKGGQKIVFPIKINDELFAIKFMLVNIPQSVEDEEGQIRILIDEVTARARREVKVIEKCQSPYLVKLGPIPLTSLDYKGQTLLYFTEQFIEGVDLRNIIIKKQKLSIKEIIRLGRNITEAIRVLWMCAKIHRDIKPGNIMRSKQSGDFILLDLGLVLDLLDESLSKTGIVPGTLMYLSPDQIDLARKRQMDFRSDIFSLGVVLYEAATGHHPFMTGVNNPTDIIAKILDSKPPSPISLRSDLPIELDNIIMRLLAKKPHLRYSTCKQLDEALAAVRI